MLARFQRNRVVREALIFLAFCLFTAALTFPYVLNLRDAVADTGDPYLVSWILWWDYHQTFTDPLNLFHANLFYPLRYTLAFSENSYGIALPFFPLYALGVRPLTVHAIALFLAFASTGYGAFRLGRTLTGSAAAGWIAGIAFAFVPFRFSMFSHVHYLFAIWIPLVFEALILFARERNRKRALYLGVAFFMSGLTCITWFAFSLVPLTVCALFLLTRHGIWRDTAFWRRGFVAIGLASLFLLPFLLPYHFVAQLYHFQRSVDEVKDGSANAVSWLAVERRNQLWHGLGDNFAGPNRFKLFPGSLPILLSLVAAVSAMRRSLQKQSEAFWIGLVLAVIGFIYTLGWNSVFYRVLYDLIPIFRSIRIAARGAMFGYLGLALLAGLGASSVAEIVCKGRPRWRYTVVGLIAALLLFELNTAPLEFVHGDVNPDAVSLRLRETPTRGGIVILPANANVNHHHVLRAADHMKPLIVGISGFNSPYEDRIEYDTRGGPIADSVVQMFEEIPASYLVVANHLVPPERRVDYEAFLGRALVAGRLRYINRFDGRDDLYAVVKTEPNARTEAPVPFNIETRDWATLIEEDPVNLLGEYRSWSQAIYRLHVASYGTMPGYAEFVSSVVAIGRGIAVSASDQAAKLEENLRRFVIEWTQRPQFQAVYGSMTDDTFLDSLARNAGLALTPPERSELVQKLHDDSATRAGALLSLVKNKTFADAHDKRSLVLLHYFGYLRRNPEDPRDGNLDGFNFWLKEIESTGEVGRLSRAFAASTEYTERKKK